MLFDADLPWANVLEQAVKNWWVYEEHAGHDPALEWPPSIHSVHRFTDVGDRGLSVLLTAWDEWAYVGVMRKIRLPLKSITFENKPFEIVLEFQWEVHTNTENRQFTFQTEIHLTREVLSEDRRQLGALQGCIEIWGYVDEAWGFRHISSECLAFFECVLAHCLSDMTA